MSQRKSAKSMDPSLKKSRSTSTEKQTTAPGTVTAKKEPAVRKRSGAAGKGKKVRTGRVRGKKEARLKSFLPYADVYEEMGMIREETDGKRSRYSAAFRIEEPHEGSIAADDPVGMNAALCDLLCGFGKITYQFFSINRRVDEKAWLSRILLPHKGSAVLDPLIDRYNDLLRENSAIGHNSMTRRNYIVFSLDAYTPDEALSGFRRIEERAKGLFENFRHLRIRCLTIGERLELLHHVCCMGTETFGLQAGMSAQNFSLEQMRTMRLSTKDLAAPRKLQKSRSRLILNEKRYARVFFLSSFPSVLSGNLISELMGISPQMVYSACYEPIDSDRSFDFVRRAVAGNTLVRSRREKETLDDRKAGRTRLQHELIEYTEEAYFAGEALDVLTDVKSAGSGLFLCTFLIVLYADSAEELEQDSRLLTLTASRFAFQIRTLDNLQQEGLCSALPLAASRVDVRRVFPASRLCALNTMEGADPGKGCLFSGMNAINDNLILVNRKSTILPSGVIAGMRSSGKTWQVRREVLGNLISTKDLVFVIAQQKESGRYEPFILSLGGNIFHEGHFCPLHLDEDYGVIEDGRLLKRDFLTALMAAVLRGNKGGPGPVEESIAMEEEADRLLSSGVRTMHELEELLYLHGGSWPLLGRVMDAVSRDYLDGTSEKGGRLNFFSVKDTSSMLIVLDMIWNLEIVSKKNNLSAWVYIDAADDLLKTPEGARYLEHLLRLSNILQNPVTLVIQNAAVFASGEDRCSFKNILPQIGCWKLLSLGPIERRMLCEELNISPSLSPYITNTGVGKGLLINQTASLPFNDNCREISTDWESLQAVFEPEERMLHG